MATDPMNKLRDLVDEANAPFVGDEVAIRRARAALLAGARVGSGRRPRALLAIAALAAGAAVALLVARAPWRADPPVLSFAFAGSLPAQHQAALPAAATPTDVTFSDGSQVTLAP